MKLGIKVGPKDWKEKLAKATYDGVEVMFNFSYENDYQQLCRHLSTHNIYAGFHFWGTLPGDYMPNLAVDIPEILKPSEIILKHAIDVAGYWGARYILFHEFPFDIWVLKNKMHLTIEASGCAGEDCLRRELENLHMLKDYALKRGTELVIETLCRAELMLQGEDAEIGEVYDNVRIPNPAEMAAYGKSGISLCADLAHLTTWYASDKRSEMYRGVSEILALLKPHTKVVHVAALKPPFIADTGNGLTPQEVSMGVFPNETEAFELLQIFKDADVLVVPEPRMKDHMWHNELMLRSRLFHSR